MLGYTEVMKSIEIRTIKATDQTWIKEFLTDHWGTPLVVSHGQSHRADQLPGFVASLDEEAVGLATYHIRGQECELVTLDSWRENLGIGTALIEAVKQEALRAHCFRLWLITTNDNIHALGFYQKRGFHLVAVHADAMAESRKIKPSIPEIGMYGIPLRDELELELILT